MRGLFLKDLYTLIRQMKVFLLMIFFFACIPGNFSLSSFTIVYAALLSITALAYDESSGWNYLAAMMPYTVRARVWSKYCIGYLLTGVAFIIVLVVQGLLSLAGIAAFGPEQILSMFFVLAIALLLQAVNLPLMFVFGAVKGRLAFIILTAVAMGGLLSLKKEIFASALGIAWDAWGVALGCIGAALLLNLISALISEQICRRKFA